MRGMFRGLKDLASGASIAHLELRNRLFTTLSIALMASVVCTIGFYFAERHHPGSDVKNLWDSFYFTTAQLTTLGSSMSNPVTATGQAMTLFMDLFAVTVCATLAGMFGAFFYHRTQSGRKKDAASDN